MENYLPAVYLLTNKPGGVLYTGVTSNLPGRIWQHRKKLIDGFTKRYNLNRLVWYEIHSEIASAITREKRIKKWNRAWKISLIEDSNLEWHDLYEDLFT